MKKPRTDWMQVLLEASKKEIKPVDPAERLRIQEANRAKKDKVKLWEPLEESAPTDNSQTNELKSPD